MSKERKQRNKPDVPPEMVEAQAESGLPELPGNIPPYLSYKPSEDTTAAFVQLQAILQSIDAKLRTSNHLQAQPMMAEMVLPSLLQLADWMMRSQRDLIVYSQHLASWSVERHVVAAVPVELGAELIAHLTKARESYKSVRELLKGFAETEFVSESPTIKETIVDIDKRLKELDEEANELGSEVEEEIYDEDDWPEEDEDNEGGEDDEDLDEEPADLVETTDPGRPRKQQDPDAEPLF